MPRKGDLRYLCVLEQPYKVVRQAQVIEAEEEAGLSVAHLKQSHLVLPSRFEGRLCLCVEAKKRLFQEEPDRPLCLVLADNDLYMPRKEHSRQVLKEFLIVSVKYRFQRFLIFFVMSL